MKPVHKRIAPVAAVVATVSLAVAGCSSTGASSADGIVTVNGTEPQNPLIPTNTNEVGGGRIVDLLYSGLVYYDEKGEVHNDMAAKIESTDNKVWTITVRSDAKFSDGKPVTAKNFVDAWNYGADPANAQLSSSFFEPIEGYQPPPADEGAKAESHPTMSGLAVKDEHTFTVTLAQPIADFPQHLGYSAFYPLPADALKNINEYGKAPLVVNGPYKLASKDAWVHNQKIDLVPNDKYNGPRKAQNKGVTIRFFTKTDAAYAELTSGTLDVLDSIPESSITSFQQELKGRAISEPVAVFQAFAIRMDAPGFSGEEGRLRRAALSMAIDRAAVTDKVFHSTRTPAKDFTSPAMPNFESVTKQLSGGDVLQFNKDKAKELWEKANAIKPFEGTFTIAYNSDGPHQSWVDAVCHQLSNNLGIKAEGKPYADFKSLRDDITKSKVTSGFRSGWQADYPSMLNFLIPTFTTAAIKGGSNDAAYANPELDKLLSQAQAATNQADVDRLTAAAQSVLLRDLPAIPLWYQNVTGGWSDKVDNVKFDWHSVPQYWKITKK